MKANCIHHWKIDNYNVGTCKYCGEVRDFGALLEREAWRLRKSPQAGVLASIGVPRRPYGPGRGKAQISSGSRGRGRPKGVRNG